MWWTIILKIIAPLLIKYGLAWVLEKFPKLPQALKDLLKKLSEELSGALSKEEKKEVRKKAARKAKAACSLTVCPPEIKE